MSTVSSLIPETTEEPLARLAEALNAEFARIQDASGVARLIEQFAAAAGMEEFDAIENAAGLLVDALEKSGGELYEAAREVAEMAKGGAA